MQSVYGITPVTKEAKAWIEENASFESWQWLEGMLYVEHNYIADLIEGMIGDGLKPNNDFRVG